MTKKLVYPEKKGWYRSWRMKKRSGGYRVIEAPNDELKEKQRKLYFSLMKKFRPSDICNCGVKGRNTTRAAKQIMGSKYKWKTDIHDFFGSITGDMILKALRANSSITKTAAEKIRYLCTNKYDVLPQGAPTSPFIANVACIKLLNYIKKAVTGCKGRVTVYADDVIISANSLENLRKSKFIAVKLINSFGLKINKDKSKYLRKKQEVLGICVSPGKDHPRLPRKTRYNLKAWLHNTLKKLENNEKIPDKELNKLYGHVAYAEMVGDQWAPRFNAKAMRIRTIVKERTNAKR